MAKRFYISSDNNIHDREEKCHYSSFDTAELCDLLNDLEQEARDNEHYHSEVLRAYKAISKENEEFKDKVFYILNAKLQLFNNCHMVNEAKIINNLIKEVYK